MKLNANKIKLRLKEVAYMGHILSDEGLKTDPSKTSAIRNIETPKNIK